MKIRNLQFFLLVIMVFACPGHGHGAQWYIRGAAGYDWSHDADFHDEDPGATSPPALFGQGPGRDGRHLAARGDFGDFPVFEVAVGAQTLDWLRADLSVTYRPDMDYEGQANFLHVTGPQPVTAEAESWTAMANLFIEPTQFAHLDLGIFRPYVGGGIGLSYNHIGRMTYRFPELTRHKVSITPSGSRTDFAYMLAVGTGIRVAKKVVLDVSYRYSDLGSVETDSGNMYMDSLPSGIDIASTSAPLRTHGFLVAFRYLF